MRLYDIWNRNCTDPLAIADEVLYTRLAETIAWTNRIVQRADFRSSMRYPDFQWRLLHEGRDDAVCTWGSARQQSLFGANIELATRCPDLLGGRLMVYFPDDTLRDGAAELETNGFFDAYNVPPWETWVSYFEEDSEVHASFDCYLLAYVPAALVDSANSGIIVNPEECIVWLSETSIQLKKRFAGL